MSNVVRGLPGVSEGTRRRVRSSIRELGYRPNVLARQLVQQRTSILGVVVGDLANPFYAEMAKLLERDAFARGYTTMFCNTGRSLAPGANSGTGSGQSCTPLGGA